MDSEQGCELVERIIEPMRQWFKRLADRSASRNAAELERQVRNEGIEQLAAMFATLMQHRVDQQDSPRPRNRPDPSPKRCDCGGVMRHGGVRQREVMTSMGPIRLHGVYRRCRDCGHSHTPVDAICHQWLSEPMRQMLVLLGVSLASFVKAQRVCRQLLGVPHAIGRGSAACRRPVFSPRNRRPVDAVGCTFTLVESSCISSCLHIR